MEATPRFLAALAALVACVLLGCGKSDNPADPEKPRVVETLRLEPAAAMVASNTRTTLKTVLFRDGTRIRVVSADSWVSANPTVAQLVAPGRIRGLHTGQINVMATFDTLTASANITVTPGSPARINMAPKNASLLIGKATHFTTTSFDSIGNQIGQLNSGITYNSNNPGRVSISANGLAEARGVGSAQLRSAYLSFRDSTDVTVAPRQIELTITGTGRDEWKAYDLVIYEPLTHVVERSVVVSFVDVSDGNRNVSGGNVTINGNLMNWDGAQYTASVLGSSAPSFTVAASGSPENYVEPFSVVTPLAPMLDINIPEKATYHVPGGELVTWTPFSVSAQLHFELYTWNYSPPSYSKFPYYDEWVTDSGSHDMSLWEVPVHFEILMLDRTASTSLSLPGYSAAMVTNRSTARRQVFTWK